MAVIYFNLDGESFGPHDWLRMGTFLQPPDAISRGTRKMVWSKARIYEEASQMKNTILTRQTAEKIIDLNDLRVYAYVASLSSFSLAADALKMHKSSVSRSIRRFEMTLETPLLHRTTRKVRLTRRGVVLKDRCVEILSCINEALDCTDVGGREVSASSKSASARTRATTDGVAECTRDVIASAY